ncbi:MAG: hypothetical protein ACM359_06085 [Bacillota bacterium]
MKLIMPQPARVLLLRLSATWPFARPSFAAGNEVSIAPGALLLGEMTAIAEGRAASLPFYPSSGAEVAWITIARDAESLQAAIADLRAWIIPSFGWDDPQRPIVIPEPGEHGEIPAALAELAPAGYFRWRTRREDVDAVAAKLSELRALMASRPHHTSERIPSLLEMRQQFHVATAAGNRDAAEAAIEAIDRYQLDTAANTAFMRILLADRFGDVNAIVGREGIHRVLALRLPSQVRTAILHAYHRVILKGLEDRNEFAEAAAAYVQHVEPDVGGLVVAAGTTDSAVVARLRGYRAYAHADATLAAEVLEAASDNPLSVLLRPLLERPPEPEPTLEQRFYQARLRGDWAAVQSLGIGLLDETDEHVPVLRKSLQFQPNSELAVRLDGLGSPPVFTDAVDVPCESVPVAPRSWFDWLSQLREQHWEIAARFSDEPHQLISEIAATEIEQISLALEELYTGDDLRPGTTLERVLLTGLAPMIEELVRDERFPEARFGALYEQLLLVWAHVRQGSLSRVDGQLLLSLADATIRVSPAAACQAVEQVRKWWESRPVRAMLAFGFEATDLLLDLTTDRDTASALWYGVAEVARQNRQVLSHTERSLLSYLADRLGIGDAIVSGYIPPVVSEEEVDPLGSLNLKKIAILHSWAPDAAHRAADLLRKRIDATIVEIQAEEKTTRVKAAGNSDLLLFLPRRSAHQLFYGLDASARDKIVYVPGVTASSIVFALEQWARKHASV